MKYTSVTKRYIDQFVERCMNADIEYVNISDDFFEDSIFSKNYYQVGENPMVSPKTIDEPYCYLKFSTCDEDMGCNVRYTYTINKKIVRQARYNARVQYSVQLYCEVERVESRTWECDGDQCYSDLTLEKGTIVYCDSDGTFVTFKNVIESCEKRFKLETPKNGML